MGSSKPDKPNPALRPKAPGEIKIITVLAHDNNHNGVAQETSIRRIFSSKKDWRIIYARTSKLVTPELLSDADLLITARTGIRDPIDFTGNCLAETLQSGEILWTEENVNAIIDNVKNRGMGFLALHCTLYCRDKNITDLMDIEPIMHNEVQPVWVRDLNNDHSITRGIEPFLINLDEQFGVVIKSPETITLFETTAIHDKRNCIGGWCLERGKGRIVGLLPGHTVWPYRISKYCEIVWRAAHWTLKQDIPLYPNSGS